MIEDLIELRSCEKSEHKFIRHSWLRSLRSHEPFYHTMQRAVFFEGHGKRIDDALDRGYCLVVSPRSEPHLVSGYIVWEIRGDDTIVHYIYVKLEFRGMGIGNLMFNSINIDGKIIASAKGTGFKKLPYNPYLLDKP